MKKTKHSKQPNPEMVQSVWITFSDGTNAGFLGKAVAFPGDTRTIRNVAFTEPRALPPGYSLEAVP